MTRQDIIKIGNTLRARFDAEGEVSIFSNWEALCCRVACEYRGLTENEVKLVAGTLQDFVYER